MERLRGKWTIGMTVQRWEKKGGEPTRLPRRELARLFREAELYEKDA